jgi:hypothetical protein
MEAKSIPIQSFTTGRSGTLQCLATDRIEPSAVPPIVHEALRSPGRSPGSTPHTLAQPRFDHDFSRLPVCTAAPMMIQSKLTIGRPADKYEREADRVAEQVLRMPEPGIQLQPT